MARGQLKTCDFYPKQSNFAALCHAITAMRLNGIVAPFEKALLKTRHDLLEPFDGWVATKAYIAKYDAALRNGNPHTQPDTGTTAIPFLRQMFNALGQQSLRDDAVADERMLRTVEPEKAFEYFYQSDEVKPAERGFAVRGFEKHIELSLFERTPKTVRNTNPLHIHVGGVSIATIGATVLQHSAELCTLESAQQFASHRKTIAWLGQR